MFSLDKILRLNKFSEKEKYEKYIAQKAFNNDELGKSLGDCDIQQVRLNKFSFDMNYLLGISQFITTDGYDFAPYYDNGTDGYWDGKINKFSEETSVGEIFIDDGLDSGLKNTTLFEINTSEVEETDYVIFDSSGNGIVGIIIGDYKLEKLDLDVESMRDSVMKVPKISFKEDGAI